MALAPRLDLRQTQSLVMTPQLQQAIQLLQLSNLELNDYIERELEQNPLLERENQEGGIDESERDNAGDAMQAADGVHEGEAIGQDGADTPDSFELTTGDAFGDTHDAAPETDFGNVWDSDNGGGGETDSLIWETGVTGSALGASLDFLPDTPAEHISLRNHLLEQVGIDFNDHIDRVIAAQITDMLDESGYLRGNVADVSTLLGCDEKRVCSVLERLQRLDPAGIFARNLAECLSIQLRELDRFDPAMQALVENLDLLAKREFAELRNLCGVDTDDLTDMIVEIKALNPKPALAFDQAVAQPVIPDVMVRRQNDGWAVELNSDTLPRVLVNNRYYAAIGQRATNKAEKEYVSQCYQSANWLVKTVHQRAQTILKVAGALVKHQEDFLERGVQHLKPLVLRDIAGEIGVHESTVSRVTNNKFMVTPRGIFELKYFFSFGLSDTAGGEAHSAEAIRFHIKSMIDKESVDEILSDDKIVVILRQYGVEIARRTVAKYRETMRIPSSVQRRRDKSLHL